MTAIPGRHREGVRDWLDQKPPVGKPVPVSIDVNRKPAASIPVRKGSDAEMPAVDPFVDDTGQLAPPPASSRHEAPADA